MKVLLCSLDSLATQAGGVEAYVHQLALALQQEGHEVRVATRRPAPDITPPAGSVEYRFVKTPRGESSHRYRLLWEPLYERFVHAEANWADVVHAQNTDGDGALGYKPLVATVHTTPLDEWESSRVGGLREALVQRPIEAMRVAKWRRFVARANHLWTGPAHVAESLRTLGARDVEVLPNPIAPPQRFTRAEARAALGWDEATPVVLYVGRLARVKRVDRLVDAMRELPRARLVIAGEGPERPALEAQAKDARVEFVGHVDDITKARLLSASDAFCLPSEHEGQPLALLEAMASGIPTVATRAQWVPPDLALFGLWGEDLPALLREALARGRGEGAPVMDHRATARRVSEGYERAVKEGPRPWR